MATKQQGTPSGRSGRSSEGRWAFFKDVLDVVVKLMAPVGVVAGSVLGYELQQSLQATPLLTQREQSDTTIRAEMFKAITERLLGSRGETPEPEERAAFTELLALNFHEHIELKPLLLKVDKDLLTKYSRAGEADRKVVSDQRDELRSVARRVRARQVATLVSSVPRKPTMSESVAGWISSAHAAQAAQSDANGAGLHFLGVRFSGKRFGAGDTSPCDVREQEVGANVCKLEAYVDSSPDGKESIAVTVTGANWAGDEFTVEVKPVGPHSALPAPQGGKRAEVCETRTDNESGADVRSGGASALTFDVTDFDFPLTDNTLLASGSRFAVFVDQVCGSPSAAGPGATGAIKLGVLWFPRDYYPARERPTTRRQLSEHLGLSIKAP